jgi:ribonucleoside-diphosphate reductase alpha subunit
MKVQKRNGIREDVSFDKVLNRMKILAGHHLSEFRPLNVDPSLIAQKVCSEIYDGVKTSELDELSAQISIALYPKNTDYGELASRISISNNHKNTLPLFSDCIKYLYDNKVYNGRTIIAKYLYTLVQLNKNMIDKAISNNADYLIDYFGYKTLEKSYLLKSKGIIIERPQYLFMRVALCIHRDNIHNAINTYKLLSLKYYTHATPTLFNAGTINEQLASCFLIAMKDDSISGIYDTLKECALISKHAGGIGLHIHNIRAKNSYINGTNGSSNGIVPMLKVFNDTAKYVDQGGGKRNGSFAIYIEPWHADIEDFLELKKNHGNEDDRARELFYGLWIPDLFMERVKHDDDWTLMCPHECPGLADVWGDEFVKLYEQYEKEGKGRSTIKAQKLWYQIITSQIETGTPYLLYKDACNSKSNQQNLGTIKSSNLCTEIIEYTNEDETAVCNLASISLSSYVKEYHVSPENKLSDDSDLVILFSKDDCVYCKLSQELLDKCNINYEVIKLNDKKERENIYMNIDSKYDEVVDTMPQIMITSNKYHRSNLGLDILKWGNFKNINYIGSYHNLVEHFRPKFDFVKLADVVKNMTINLNKVIDYNYYPVKTAENSNTKHRPIGIGVQGLANVFFKMKLPFSSDAAIQLNKDIFETIYFAAVTQSMIISRERGDKINQYNSLKIELEETDSNKSEKTKELSINYINKLRNLKNELKFTSEEFNRESHLGSYSSFIGSPISKGQFQFDLWDIKPSDTHDWETLRKNVMKYGVRNSLLVAPMPTASTAQILGNYECFEPIISNIYLRRVLAGEYIVVNKYLIDDLSNHDLWNDKMKDMIILNRGSIQNIPSIPDYIKELYKTSWEIKQKVLIDMSRDRGAFICQSQSLNLFMENPDFQKLTSMHFYAWKQGLKTGIYYLRTKSASKAIQFTIDPRLNNECESCSG